MYESQKKKDCYSEQKYNYEEKDCTDNSSCETIESEIIQESKEEVTYFNNEDITNNYRNNQQKNGSFTANRDFGEHMLFFFTPIMFSLAIIVGIILSKINFNLLWKRETFDSVSMLIEKLLSLDFHRVVSSYDSFIVFWFVVTILGWWIWFCWAAPFCNVPDRKWPLVLFPFVFIALVPIGVACCCIGTAGLLYLLNPFTYLILLAAIIVLVVMILFSTWLIYGHSIG